MCTLYFRHLFETELLPERNLRRRYEAQIAFQSRVVVVPDMMLVLLLGVELPLEAPRGIRGKLSRGHALEAKNLEFTRGLARF